MYKFQPSDISQGLYDIGKVFAEDLYGTLTDNHYWYGKYSKEKLDRYNFYQNVPLYGQYINYKLDKIKDAQYLNRYGMDYSDILDPRKLYSSSSASQLYGSVLNYASRNISRLYR